MDDLTLQGIQALKGGEKEKARSLFLSALEKNEDNPLAWLWLSGAVENNQDRIECLQQVLRIDPNNQAAKNGLAIITEKVQPSIPLGEPDGLSTEKEEPSVQPFVVNENQEVKEPPVDVFVNTADQNLDQAVVVEAQRQNVEPLITNEPEPALASTEKESDLIADKITGETDQVVDKPLEEVAPPVSEPTFESESIASDTAPDDYVLPESFFSSSEKQSETFPDWMASLGGNQEAPSDAVMPVEKDEALRIENKESLQNASIPTPEDTNSTEDQGTTFPAFETSPKETEGKTTEKVILKFRPSLSTAIIVYGLGIIVLFFLFITVMTLITNMDSTPIMILLGLMFVVILVVLGFFIARIVDHLTTSYILTNRRIYLEKGISNRKRKSIHLPKIKSLSLKQGLLQKIMGMGNLILTSEGHEGDDVTKLIDVANVKRVIRRLEGEQRNEN